MAKNLKGSKTEANLMSAFVNESQVRTKYTIFEEKAKEEGFEQISKIFKKTADNEKAHAEVWFKILHDDAVQSTGINLTDAFKGESFEHDKLYAEYAKVAEEEGFTEIAKKFRLIGEIEKNHADRYKTFSDNIKKEKVFKRKEKQTWICLNCGHMHVGVKAPEVCEVCGYGQAYFQVKEN